MTSIPPELGRLTALTRLSLGKQLKSIPKELGGLTSLRLLILYANPDLGELPDEVEALRTENGGILQINRFEVRRLRLHHLAWRSLDIKSDIAQNFSCVIDDTLTCKRAGARGALPRVCDGRTCEALACLPTTVTACLSIRWLVASPYEAGVAVKRRSGHAHVQPAACWAGLLAASQSATTTQCI